ncbi:MAG: hypothetical protein ACRCVI_01885 [Mycoplasmoidaceae bacterium]
MSNKLIKVVFQEIETIKKRIDKIEKWIFNMSTSDKKLKNKKNKTKIDNKKDSKPKDKPQKKSANSNKNLTVDEKIDKMYHKISAEIDEKIKGVYIYFDNKIDNLTNVLLNFIKNQENFMEEQRKFNKKVEQFMIDTDRRLTTLEEKFDDHIKNHK